MENEVCEDIVKEFPSLKTTTECQYIPIQKCSPDDVPSTLLTKPVVKKVIWWICSYRSRVLNQCVLIGLWIKQD